MGHKELRRGAVLDDWGRWVTIDPLPMGRNTMIKRPPESWSNPMTRCVYTWLGQEEEYWSEVAAEICDICFNSKDAWLNVIHKLANRFRDAVEASYPYLDRSTRPLPDLFCELLDSALAMINYREIARAFLTDLDKIDYFKAQHGTL